MVLQEDGSPNNGACGDRTGFSPKKPKPNKIPQRGLGIAALEKLRREDQQRRIAAAFSTGDNIAGATAASAGGGEHFSATVIPPIPSLPVLEQSTKPYVFGNYALLRPHSDHPGDSSSPLVRNSIQSESSSNSSSRLPLLPRKLQQEQHRCSLVIKNFLSPPSSSGASLQIEPPSNQSYVSINPPPMSDQKSGTLTGLLGPSKLVRANLSGTLTGLRWRERRSGIVLACSKRRWPFQPGSAPHCGNDHKRISLSRDDASSSSCSRVDIRAEGEEASKLDGSILSLSLLPVSEQKGLVHCLQHIQKNREESVSEVVGPPTLYNFMGLPHDLIGSHHGDNSDTERNYH